MIKKKVKKIPKYNGGGSVLDTLLKNNPVGLNNTNIQSGATAGTIANGTTWETANKIQRTNMVVDAVAGGLDLVNMATSGQLATMGTALSGIAKGASAGAMFGPIGAGVGAAAGLIAGTAGRKNDVNYASSSTDINHVKKEGSGWIKLLGPSDEEMLADANRVQNRNIAKIQTEQTKANYMNNPNVQLNPVLAAEGGIMRTPVDALVSKGELIYDPTTKKLRQVPGSKGKPNKADDVYAKLYEGDVVISNSPTMLMANGKTPALNLMGMVDKYATGGTVKAREAIIKKVVNWLEANKTKPQEYAKFDEGYPGFFSYLMSNRTRPIDAVISEYMKYYGKTAKEFKGFDGSDKSFLLGLLNIINANDEYVLPIRFTGGKSFDQVRSMPISSAVEFNPEYWDYYNQQSKPNNTSNANVVKPTKPLWQPTENIGITTHPEIDNVWSRHKTSDFVAAETPVTAAPAVSKKKLETVSSKKGTVNKPSSDKKTTVVSQNTPPTQINQTQLDWASQEAAKAMSQYAPNTTRPIAPGLVSPKIDQTETVEEKPLPEYTNNGETKGSNKFNWGDLAYKAASIFTPLFDREKAESVQYQVPVAKYRPTSVNIDPQRRAIDEGYAMARYNQANISPNTGAGMAYGLQAATNRAKQLSDVYSWQTNAQNNLIGQNVDTYNKWSADYANIMNNVYDKAAANRATARNINRQNRATALKNWGQIRRDDKSYEMDRMKLQMLDPMLLYGYENYDNYLKWKKENGYG